MAHHVTRATTLVFLRLFWLVVLLSVNTTWADDTQDFQIDTNNNEQYDSEYPDYLHENRPFTSEANHEPARSSLEDDEDSTPRNPSDDSSEAEEENAALKPRTRAPHIPSDGVISSFGLKARTVPSKIVGAVAVPGGRVMIGFAPGNGRGPIRLLASPLHPSGIKANNDGYPNFSNYFLGTVKGRISEDAKVFNGYPGERWLVAGNHLAAGLDPRFGNLPTRVSRIQDCSPLRDNSLADRPIFSPTGEYECFRLILVLGLASNEPFERRIFHATATIVSKAFYENGGRLLEPDRPKVVSAKLASPLTMLRDIKESGVIGFEPSLTADSRLLAVQVLKGTGGPGHAFLFSPTPWRSDTWSVPIEFARMHNERERQFCTRPGFSLTTCEPRYKTTLGEAYPILAKPLRDFEGRLVSRSSYHIFGYPWIDFDGRNILFQANRRSNASIVGVDTQYRIFQIDGPPNLVTNYQRPNSSSMACPEEDFGLCKGLTFSIIPGTATGFWGIYPDAPKALFPFTQLRPLLFAFNRTPSLIGKGEAVYSEVSTNDSVDSDYLVALQMNEPVVEDRHYEYNKIFSTFNVLDDRIADTSANGHTAYLSQGAAFPRARSGSDTPQSNESGFRGKAVFFPPGGRARIDTTELLSKPRHSLTVEIAVKLLGNINSATPLVVKNGAWALRLGPEGEPRVSLWIGEQEYISGSIGTALTPGRWHHILFTYRGAGTSRFRFFLDGKELFSDNGSPISFQQRLPATTINKPPTHQGLPHGAIAGSTSPIVLGPLPSNRAASTSYVYALDEFRLSRIARDDSYAKIASYAPNALTNISSSVGKRFPIPLSLGLPAHEATLPQPVAELIDAGTFHDAVKLGEKLFHDPMLSTNSKGKSQGMSCATCHIPGNAFSDPTRFVMRNTNDTTGHTVPTLINRAFSTHQLRDMSASDLVAQALLPLKSPHEMNADLDQVAAKLLDTKGRYFKPLDLIFNITAHGKASPRQQADRALHALAIALASFETTIVSGNSLVDQIRAGSATSPPPSVVRGMHIFESKGRCTACHSGPNFTDELAHVTGTAMTTNATRGAITERARDAGALKTPTLRSLTNGPFFHNGAAKTLAEVVAFYNVGGRRVPNLDPEMRPLHLTPQEMNDLVEFLRALRGQVSSGIP